ncbi:MAG: uridine kinase [Planctomycetota bacterium]|nr:MAG: uridine kinase [Planctomycetota bacterium]
MTVLVGIAGGSGSGKTTIASALSAHYPPEHLQIVPLDAYYADRSGMPPQELARVNYDHPEAFDQLLLLEHMSSLKAGQAVEQPLYDYTTHRRLPETRAVPPAPVVVLEGILVLAMEAVLPLLDLKLFVDTDADVRFLRRLRRDMAERGRSFDSVMLQYMETVRPMHRQFIEPTRREADLILPGEGDYGVVLEVLRAWIDRQLTAED